MRDYCESLGWDKTPPGPELPDDVVAGTRARYVEAFERLTGIAFDDYLADPEVVAMTTQNLRMSRGPRMKATVLVRPKSGILDPQGEAVRTALDHLGFGATEARVGRVIDLEFPGSSEEDARRELERMCEELLANPLIESYEIEVHA